MPDLLVKGNAVYSPSEAYRYSLTRTWDQDLPRMAIIMLNPSTATADVDDATTRRVLGFAQDWGYGSYEAVNLFALRSSSPWDLRKVADPVGQHNDAAILTAVKAADLVLAAWGTHGNYHRRDRYVLDMLEDTQLWCLCITKGGHPGHPLYLPKDVRPIEMPGQEEEG